MSQVTLKELIDYFQQDLNDPESIVMAIEQTIRIVKKEHNTEINIFIRMIWIYEIMTIIESVVGSFLHYWNMVQYLKFVRMVISYVLTCIIWRP